MHTPNFPSTPVKVVDEEFTVYEQKLLHHSNRKLSIPQTSQKFCEITLLSGQTKSE